MGGESKGVKLSIRWRADGRLVCAAVSDAEEGDTYIDDRLHYALSVEARALIADIDHETNGLWHWTHGQFLKAIPENQLLEKHND